MKHQFYPTKYSDVFDTFSHWNDKDEQERRKIYADALIEAHLRLELDFTQEQADYIVHCWRYKGDIE